jgi:hypothetical protein
MEIKKITQDGEVKLLSINNGVDKVKFNAADAKTELERLTSPQVARKMIARVASFERQVSEGSKNGVHVGSSNLVYAIEAEFYGADGVVDPELYGLQTATELKLAAALLCNYLVRD